MGVLAPVGWGGTGWTCYGTYEGRQREPGFSNGQVSLRNDAVSSTDNGVCLQCATVASLAAHTSSHTRCAHSPFPGISSLAATRVSLRHFDEQQSQGRQSPPRGQSPPSRRLQQDYDDGVNAPLVQMEAKRAALRDRELTLLRVDNERYLVSFNSINKNSQSRAPGSRGLQGGT